MPAGQSTRHRDVPFGAGSASSCGNGTARMKGACRTWTDPYCGLQSAAIQCKRCIEVGMATSADEERPRKGAQIAAGSGIRRPAAIDPFTFRVEFSEQDAQFGFMCSDRMTRQAMLRCRAARAPIGRSHAEPAPSNLMPTWKHEFDDAPSAARGSLSHLPGTGNGCMDAGTTPTFPTGEKSRRKKYVSRFIGQKPAHGSR